MGIASAVGRFVRRRPYLAFAAAAAVFAVAGFGAAVTINENTFKAVFGSIQTVDSTLQVTTTSIGIAKTATSASGTTVGSAVEMSTGASGAGNTALTRAHWTYRAVIEETGVASVTANTYKAELFVDGVSAGSLYFTQGASNDAAVEGVVFRWDIGEDLPSGDTSYRIAITQV